MKNWKSEFQINYHVNFLMKDATVITKYEGIVTEAENEKQVQNLVQSYFKTNPESFVEFPEYITSSCLAISLIISSGESKKLYISYPLFLDLVHRYFLHLWCLLHTKLTKE